MVLENGTWGCAESGCLDSGHPPPSAQSVLHPEASSCVLSQSKQFQSPQPTQGHSGAQMLGREAPGQKAVPRVRRGSIQGSQGRKTAITAASGPFQRSRANARSESGEAQPTPPTAASWRQR